MQLKHLLAGSLIMGFCLAATAQAQNKVKEPASIGRKGIDKSKMTRTTSLTLEQRQAFGAPDNDECDSAEENLIFDGFTPFININANTDGVAWTIAECSADEGGGEDAFQDVWWGYTASCTGDLTITTCDELGGGSTFDTTMALYSGACDGLTLVDCNDDIPVLACGDAPGFQSGITTPVTAGDEFVLRVGGWDTGQSGTGTIAITCDGVGSCGDGACQFPTELCDMTAGCVADCAAFQVAENQANGNCFDGIDNDCTGGTDCADASCQTGSEDPSQSGTCSDGIDNDCDDGMAGGGTDCTDPDCATAALCNPCAPCTDICPEDGDTLKCQSPNQMSNNGVSGVTSDLNTTLGFTAADNFRPLFPGAGQLFDGACVYGSYILFDAPGSVDCGPGNIADDFRVTILNDDNGGLLPGTVKAGPWTAVDGLTWTKAYTGNTITTDAGNMREQFIFSFTLPEMVSQDDDECLWLEVANNTEGSSGNCGWLWDTTGQGDGVSAQDVAGDGYQAGDENQNDQAFCVNLATGINTTDVCGPLTSGACCTSVTGVCLDDVPFNKCTGQFTADTLCADLDPVCGFAFSACSVDDAMATNQLCQLSDQGGGGTIFNASGFDVADRLEVDVDTLVNQVCWWGQYLDFAEDVDCQPGGVPDDFTITFYNDDNTVLPGGLPGTILAGPYNVGAVEKLETGLTLDGYDPAFVEFSYSTTVPDLNLTAGSAVWLQVSNNVANTESQTCDSGNPDPMQCENLGCPANTLCEADVCTDCIPVNNCAWLIGSQGYTGDGVSAQTAAGGAWDDPEDTGDIDLAVCIGEPASCETIADCGDTDGDGFRDDPCLHYQCVDNVCVESMRGQGQTDMGGQFGACENDGACDGNDRNLALNCFGNSFTGDQCEDAPPQAINVDGGGQFGSCVLDGVCDGNDANAALGCFGNDQACPCGAGPAPAYEEPEIEVVGKTGVTLRASANRVRPGDLVSVDIYFDDAVEDIKSYQLHVVPTGGDRGQLELIDIAVEKRRDLAFDVEWQAFNVDKAQLVVGMDPPGVPTAAGAYLATYTYRASRNASGTFAIELLHDNSDSSQRTFLFPTPNLSKIEVTGVTGAKIVVEPVRRVSR